VFDAKIVSAGQIAFRSFHIAFFISRSSTTASMIMSQSASAASSVVKVNFDSAASRCSGVTFPFSIPFAKTLSIPLRDF
jgi:hypothetical protein